MPADPGTTLSSAERLPTSDADIGHLAPDFSSRKLFNSLVIRPQYRISLRLGEIDDLCPYPSNTPRGRIERMQVLGLFYYPLLHNQVANAFNGIAAAGGAPAVTGAWDYYKSNILNGADDGGADGAINSELHTWIVAGGALPPPTDEGVAPVEANFTKIRLPGGYAIMASWWPPAIDLDNDPAYTTPTNPPPPAAAGVSVYTLGADIYAVETRFRTENPVIGKIPLIATVEKWNTATAAWEPLPDAYVYFEFLPPYDLPAFDPARAVNNQLNRPPMRSTALGPLPAPPPAPPLGPATLTNSEEARNVVAGNPQANNCLNDRGGKRGAPAIGGVDPQVHLFKTDSTPGFNAAHAAGTVAAAGGFPASPGRPLTHTAFPVAEVDTPTRSKAKTNADGQAGIIFMPSRAGGDRYRIRAFLGPPTIASTGAEDTAVRVDTGTFVIWRNLRISRFVRQQVNNPAAVLLADVNNGTFNITTNTRYLQGPGAADTAGTVVGLAAIDFSETGTANADFDGIRRNWARSFVEVDIDRVAAANLPEDLSAADFLAARQQALRDATVGMGNFLMNLDLARLYHLEAGSTVDVTNAVVNIPMRTPQSYNALVPAAQQIGSAATPANTAANVINLTNQYMLPGFLRFLSNNGYRPGLTIIQGTYGYTWQIIGLASDFSGVALEYRGCFVWAGAASYPTTAALPAPVPPFAPGATWQSYGCTSNTCHELGHCCYRLHGPGFNPGFGAPGGANSREHDLQPNNESVCVMSYQTCEGQFCAKCLFAMRGWDYRALP